MKLLRPFSIFMILVLLSGLGFLPSAAQSPDATVSVTILHTNDFHGNLLPSGSNPGMGRVAYEMGQVINNVGAENVLILDAGDIMQGTLLSNLFHGESTIDIYNQVGYDGATFGNHEFDWGQTVLISRTNEAEFPFLSANIVVDDTGDCATAGWTSPEFAEPYMVKTFGVTETVTVGVIAVTSTETPYITVDWATEGLCFKDPTESILHYYDELDAQADALVVLSHLGFNDGGYGYGFTVYGDKTLAQNLIDEGKPVDLIIGGHSHTDLAAPTVIGDTTVVQAHYAGRKIGNATLNIDSITGDVTVDWERITVATSGDVDPVIAAAIDDWANDPWYLSEINRVVGFTDVPITRFYDGDSLMGAFVNDAIYYDLNGDAEPDNDVDMVFNNAGGLRADITFPVTTTLPVTLTHGMLYSVLPFGNQTVVGEMTGAQIVELLNQSATLFKGALQVSGIRYDFYRYLGGDPAATWAWGAFNIEVLDKDTSTWLPIDLGATYKIATNEFLAPAGQDGFTPFKYVTNITYWGDMLDGVERYVAQAYTHATPYDGVLDGRITRVGNDTDGPIVPVTILHHSDSHGNLVKTSYPGYSQLAYKIDVERSYNPDNTFLLNAGDSFQGDAMMYYFKTAGLGYAADGTPLDPALQINPLLAAFNLVGYDAMTVGNHEYNFGHEVFTSTLGLADFPVLQANIEDDGTYGLDEVPVQDYILLTTPDGIEIAVMGIGNHRIPNYELPSNIPGLTFTNPISKALELSAVLAPDNDAVVALTHIGFTEMPGSVEVDNNVDTYMAANVPGIDLILGGHSHTNPVTGYGAYKYLPTIIENPDGEPVMVNHTYRYNNTLGEVILGFMDDGAGGWELVTQAGRTFSINVADPEDPDIVALAQPYVDLLTSYNNTVLGQTTEPIDALSAYTQETNAANLQADSAIWELNDNGIVVDFHLSGAMSNRAIAAGATITNPYTLTVSNMFTLMPYENSLVAIEMNGPQIKTVLERGYRNYYYYKYVPGYGGYSYYTTCMIDTNEGVEITYNDTYPFLPNGNNVISLEVDGVPIDFTDADTYYVVSTVNYLAAGSCNFNDGGVTLWPLDQIVHDTQLYVRDAVINYTTEMGLISPVIEGRLIFESIIFETFMPLIFR